jgi:hypothetical protein
MEQKHYLLFGIVFSLCIMMNYTLDGLERTLAAAQKPKTIKVKLQQPKIKESRIHDVYITAYPPLAKYTDSRPWEMASGKRVYAGAAALSRDLEHKYNKKFGDSIMVPGVGRVIFEDRSAPWVRNTVDILMFSEQECKRFGKKLGTVIFD